MQEEKILILDFGGQYSQLIARRVRECNVYSLIKPYNYDVDKIKELNPSGIILSGGPKSVTTADAPSVDKEIFNMGIPIMGICYGMQLMTSLMPGGEVEKAEHGEYGKAKLEILDEDILFANIESKTQVWMSHGDQVNSIPDGFQILAKTEITPVAALYNSEKKLYGVQFHPEVVHTIEGKNILRNFLYKVCQLEANWTMADYINNEVARIQKQVGDEKVICGLSGGVDSSVASALVYKAIGKQLTCIFVDHGLL